MRRYHSLVVFCGAFLLALAGFLATHASAQGRGQGRGGVGQAMRKFRDVVKKLELTDDQKVQLRELVMEHRGNLRSPEFKKAFDEILTDEQRETLKKAMEETPASASATAEGVVVKRDIPYFEVDGVDSKLLSLDVYSPEDGETFPVIVFVHGGGWRNGDKGQATMKGTFFARRGFVLVSVNYRLSPAVVHPVHIQDVIRALKWVKDRIGEFKGDPRRMYLMGHSAGAHLAALAGVCTPRLAEHGLAPSDFRGVILLDGAGYDIARQMDELGGGPKNSLLYRTAFTEDRELWREASPVTHAKTGKGFAPYLIFHVGDREASRQQSHGLADALKASGGKAAVVSCPGKTHATINREVGKQGDPVTAIMVRVLAALEKGGDPFTRQNLDYEPSVEDRGDDPADPEEQPKQASLDRARQLIAAQDRDGDGKVSREEWPEGTRSRFDRADADGDGFVTAEELAALLR